MNANCKNPGDRKKHTSTASPAPMPDIYEDEPTVEVLALTVEDEPSSDRDESTGFNPYDTGVLQK